MARNSLRRGTSFERTAESDSLGGFSFRDGTNSPASGDVGLPGKIDYGIYRLSIAETAVGLMQAAGLTALFTWVFYHSWLGMAAFPAVAVLILRDSRQNRCLKRRQRLGVQFMDLLLSVTAALQAGRSAENAFLDASGQMRSLHGEGSEIVRELEWIRQGLANRMPIEQLLTDLGRRSHVEEIQDFAEVFLIARRMGGNLRESIRRTAELTRRRLEVEQEIQGMLHSRQFEMKVMLAIPFLLYGYLQISSAGFFDALYHNPAGILIMTVCMGLYLAAAFLAGKVTQIRV